MKALKYGFPPEPLPYPNPYITPDMMALIIIAIICAFLIGWASLHKHREEHAPPYRPPDMYVPLDEPRLRRRVRFRMNLGEGEIPREFRDVIVNANQINIVDEEEDITVPFLIVDITDEMDEEEP